MPLTNRLRNRGGDRRDLYFGTPSFGYTLPCTGTVQSNSLQSSSLKSIRDQILYHPFFFLANSIDLSLPLVTQQPSLSEGYGEDVFKGAVADKYLKEQGLTCKDLDDYTWINDKAKPDQIAKAMMCWALDRKATSFCHWFQPMASTFRHGDTGCVQMSMLEFNDDGTPTFELKGKNILFGETDGSSYPNGGMRDTHTAGGYLAIDPSSPVFLRGDCIYIPACLVSFDGKALDEKTPLHRAHQAMSKEGARLFKHMGMEIDGMVNNIGLEQEIFFVPREAYERRLDLQFTGRTVMGRMPARGQEGWDHYVRSSPCQSTISSALLLPLNSLSCSRFPVGCFSRCSVSPIVWFFRFKSENVVHVTSAAIPTVRWPRFTLRVGSSRA